MRVRVLCLALAIQGCWPMSAFAQRSEPSATLIEMWANANDRCRGGSGDSPKTEASCDERERIAARLERLNRCFGKRGQSSAQMIWHVCTSDSIVSAKAPNCVVADPSDTPLNVRTGPNGKVVSTVPNATRVVVLDNAIDRTGDAWAYIVEDGERPLGWVFRRYIVCK